MSNEFDFSGYEEIINQNFYKDDFTHLSELPDANGNKVYLFPPSEDYFDPDSSSEEDESLDFL